MLNFEAIRHLGLAIDEVSNSTARALVLVRAGERAFYIEANIKELANRNVATQLSVWNWPNQPFDPARVCRSRGTVMVVGHNIN